jgi:hypothetical protein
VEGFSTPRSTKRIASLPSPCPIGLQSCFSALPGSPPLWSHRLPAPHQIHAPPESRLGASSVLDPLPARIPTPQALTGSTSAQIHTSLGSLPLGPCCDPSSTPDPCLAGVPCPSSPLPLRSCWTPAPHGMTGYMPCQNFYPSGPAEHQLLVTQPQTLPTGTPAPWVLLDPALPRYPPLGPHWAPTPCERATSPAPPVSPPLRSCWAPDPRSAIIPTPWVPHPSGPARP